MKCYLHNINCEEILYPCTNQAKDNCKCLINILWGHCNWTFSGVIFYSEYKLNNKARHAYETC